MTQTLHCLSYRGTDCLEDMSHSAIVHDGIFGFGNERQNINSEKLFEDAAAKGFRPCTYAHTFSSRAGVPKG